MLTPKQKVDIIDAYQTLTPMIVLANGYGITRQCIYKILKTAWVDTRKLSNGCRYHILPVALKYNEQRQKRENMRYRGV